MSDMTAGIDLEAIEARANAATPGTWEVDDPNTTFIAASGENGRYEYIGDIDPRSFSTTPRSREENEANAAFIARARTDIPALIAEVKRLRAALAESRP